MKIDFSWNASNVTYSLGAPSLNPGTRTTTSSPTFGGFFTQWRAEKLPEWRRLHVEGIDQIAHAHLLPWFGDRLLSEITKQHLLEFRAHLAALPGTRGRKLSASRINKIMVILGQILVEGCERYRLSNPAKSLRRIKAPKPLIDPFSLEEVWKICDEVGDLWRDYLVCRFFTGMRTGEINGLRWSRVDLDGQIIQVRETFSAGRAEDGGKSQHSIRDVPLLPPALAVLGERADRIRGNPGDYVFTSPRGGPVDAKNFTNRVFYPALDRLGIARRRPYQTRHTTATLLLAAGENPEWIARFLGHADTTMLFTVYSRYVPNLTRQDGSAVSAFIQSRSPVQHSKGRR